MQAQISSILGKDIPRILFRHICTSRCLSETHYDTLKLPRSCSSRDIRNAFIRLSKVYHPDKNDKDSHVLFVRLNEAYSVLSRSDSRQQYDLSLRSGTYRPNRRVAYYDPSFWENRDRSKDHENIRKPYYGIKGFKKMSNNVIALFFFIFSAIGVSLQVLLINRSVTFSRKAMDEESQRNAQVCTMVRERAAREGNEKMIERMQVNADKYIARRKKLAEQDS